MLFSLLALRLNGTHQNFYHHVRNNQDIPLVALFYAPWCGHCKRLLPIFDKIMEKYENNTEIAFMHVNCSSEDGLCQKNDISLFPSYVLGLYNETRIASMHRSEAGIENDIARLLKIKNRKYEKVVDEKVKASELPIFKFVINPQDEEMKRKIDVSIAALADYELNHFQVTYSTKAVVGKPKFSVQVDEDFVVEMKREPTIFNFIDFATENSIPIFSFWTFPMIRNIQRRFAILIPKDPKDFQTYRYLAHKYYDNFAWGNDSGARRNNIIEKYFNVTKKDLPAIVIMDFNAV